MAEGDVFTAARPGGKRQGAGRVPDAPAALEFTESAWYAATYEIVITSTNGGATWQVLVGAQE